MCEKIFEVKEYELLRYWLSGQNSKEGIENLKADIHDKLDLIVNEVLTDEEHLKNAVESTKDVYGKVHLRGTITPFIIIANYEIIKRDITEKLLKNLLYEYQDDDKKEPMLLAGRAAFGCTFLEAVLSILSIKFSGEQSDIIANCVIKSSENVSDFNILTLFFIRNDINIEAKKKVINCLDDNVLYLLKQSWEEYMFDFLAGAFSEEMQYYDGEDVEELEDMLEMLGSGCQNILEEVKLLIDKKICG